MRWNIWTGAAWEDWAPSDIESVGIGGSETAAVMMSRSLAKLGHDVTLYGQFKPNVDGTSEVCEDGGVTNFTHVKNVLDPGQISGDVFISSRDIRALALQPSAKAKAVWVHDINLGHDTHDQINKFDSVMCLSNWSGVTIEGYYPHVSKKKIFITRNGLELSRFSPKLSSEEVIRGKSSPPRFTFSSSPDRGLDKLLDWWPKIREFAPGAELHVYYGFDTWKLMAKGNSAALGRIAWFARRLSDMESQGVIFHGRVGQRELAESFMKSTLWLYPTDFKETSCITAMEAMASGCLPVCTGLAALKETVSDRGSLIRPYNMEARYEVEFLAEVKRLLENPEERSAKAIAARQYALANLSWDGVAAQWTEHFTKLIAEKERG